jgi:zinc transport system ATP-binding protein
VKRSVREEAKAVLTKFSAERLMYRRIGELSGGELQRVLLAMAMTPVPDLLLLDEPVSAVDVQGLSLFYEIVSRLKQEYDISVIMATHDLAGIAPHADRMVLLNRTIVVEGTPKEVFANKKLLEIFQLSLWNISSLIND